MARLAIGRPVHGEVHSTNASSGVEIILYTSGGIAVDTIGATERLIVTSVRFVAVVSADTYVHVGTSASTPAAGEFVMRGTFAANGGFAGPLDENYVGAKGSLPFITAASGVADAFLTGFISEV